MVCVFGWHWQPQGTSPLGFTVSSLYRFLPRLCCFPWNRLELFPSRKWDGISQSFSEGERRKAVNWVNKSFIQLTNIFWVPTVCSCVCGFPGLPWSALCRLFPWTLPSVWAARWKLYQEGASLDFLFWPPQHLVPLDTPRWSYWILNYVTRLQILREISVLKDMVGFLSDQFQLFLLEEDPHILLSSIHCPSWSWSNVPCLGARDSCCLSQRLGFFWNFLGVSVYCLHRNRLVYSKELDLFQK